MRTSVAFKIMFITAAYCVFCACSTKGTDWYEDFLNQEPWEFSAFRDGSVEITENECPNGLEDIEGSWSFVGETKAANFEDVIRFHNNRFVELLKGFDLGLYKDGYLKGHYFCWENKNRIVFVIEEANPEDLFGNKSGDSFPCDILTGGMISNAPKSFLLMCYPDWDTGGSWMDFQYVKVEPCTPASKACLPGENVIICNDNGNMWLHQRFCPDKQKCEKGECVY